MSYIHSRDKMLKRRERFIKWLKAFKKSPLREFKQEFKGEPDYSCDILIKEGTLPNLKC